MAEEDAAEQLKMERIMPWQNWGPLIEPHYLKKVTASSPIGLSIMLCIYFLQHWFNPSDPAAEEALYDSPALRRFAGVDLGRAAAPDETTILNFRQHFCWRSTTCAEPCWRRSTITSESRGIRIAYWHHRGRDHHPRSLLDQEPDRHTGP